MRGIFYSEAIAQIAQILYFRPKTNHFQALRAPVIGAHKFVYKSLLSTLKILFRIDHIYFTQEFQVQKPGDKNQTATFDT